MAAKPRSPAADLAVYLAVRLLVCVLQAAPVVESLAQLADLWGRERVYFVAGNFPAISTTRNWMDTGHYSQMVWRTTTQVGCGFARGPGLDFLVCNYNPPGNVMGQRPF